MVRVLTGDIELVGLRVPYTFTKYFNVAVKPISLGGVGEFLIYSSTGMEDIIPSI